ncbi:hypothetical protein ACWCXH_39830 [Kitasatospora sp. NPDC001660]
MKKLRVGVAAVIVAGVLTLSACGHNGGNEQSGVAPASSSSHSSQQADAYQNAPWRLQVVNLLTALQTPQDGKYKQWMTDDPTTPDPFIYTPRSSSDPGWSKRSADGSASVWPNELSPADKEVLFKAITRGNTVIASTLTVTEVDGLPNDQSAGYKFHFTVKTTDGKSLSGMALGHNGLVATREVARLTYDVTP